MLYSTNARPLARENNYSKTLVGPRIDLDQASIFVVQLRFIIYLNSRDR